VVLELCDLLPLRRCDRIGWAMRSPLVQFISGVNGWMQAWRPQSPEAFNKASLYVLQIQYSPSKATAASSHLEVPHGNSVLQQAEKEVALVQEDEGRWRREVRCRHRCAARLQYICDPQRLPLLQYK